MKYIHLPFFLISLSIGLLLVYLYPNYKKVYVFPTPENFLKLQFMDKGNTCFEYEKLTVPCSSANEITDYEIQQ